MLAWVGGSKRRLKSSLKKKPRVEGITTHSPEDIEWKSKATACPLLRTSQIPGKSDSKSSSRKGTNAMLL